MDRTQPPSARAPDIDSLKWAFADGSTTPSHCLADHIARIETLDREIGSYVAFNFDDARRAAEHSTRRWAAGVPSSPIDGVPLAIKANIAVRGLPWTAGIGAWRDRLAAQDADCVARLRSAGAVILGTVNMDEGALGARTDNPWFGRTQNPRRHGHTAGGSSGGAAAAVSADLCVGALGTDTMGSIRIPAAYCGVYGWCPARRIDRAGIVPLADTYDRVGVLGRSFSDCVTLGGVLTASREEAGVGDRLAYLELSPDDGIDPPVLDAYLRDLEQLRNAGIVLVAFRFADLPLDPLCRQLLVAVEVEGHAVHRSLLARPEVDLSDSLRAMLDYGGRLSADRVDETRRALSRGRDSLRRQLQGFVGLLLPTTPQLALRFDEPPAHREARFTALANIAGWSVLSIPTETDGSDLPHAIQLMCSSDASLIRQASRLLAHLDPLHRDISMEQAP